LGLNWVNQGRIGFFKTFGLGPKGMLNSISKNFKERVLNCLKKFRVQIGKF